MTFYGVWTREGMQLLAEVVQRALSPPPAADHVLLETGDDVLLETSDLILLE